MADSEDKAKQLAAARKRAALQAQELKKKKGGKAKAGASTAKKGEAAEKSPTTAESGAAVEDKPAPEEDAVAEEKKPAAEEEKDELSPISPTLSNAPLAQQSKARSASFRKPSISGPLSPGLFSPDGETAPDIYRKHVARIEELEKENKRLAKEATGSEKRWQKAEDELSALREGDADTSGEKGSGSTTEVERLRNDLLALQRQNSQLQSQLSRGGGGPRHGSSPSIAMSTPAGSELEAQLQSKSATIETMELEMSRLRAQVERLSVSASTPSEQITALEEKLARAEKAAALAQRELGDLRRNLDRTSEKAVREGSERASAETKLRALEREAADLRTERDAATTKADALERKVTTLTTVHKDQDGRTQALRKEKERADKETAELVVKLERVEAENLRLRKKDAADGGGDDEAVDELVDEGRRRLEDRVRELEAENTDLRRGIWHERRKEMQTGPDDGTQGARFTDVDLGSVSPSAHRRGGPGGGGFGDFFASGLNALTGANAAAGAAGGDENEGFLDDDGDMDFDEDAFRKAHEEEAKKRIERIKEVKRSLKNWEGWRLDLVESRRGGGEGIGEIFEI